MRVLPFIALLMLASQAQAGNWSSGGGNAVILPDDTVVLADPFVIRHGQKGELNAKIRAELERIGTLLEAYGGARENRFMKENVFNPLTEYRFVDELPRFSECQTEESEYGDGSFEALACTVGPITWFRSDLFQRMTVREQAKAVMHERLHAHAALPHEIIADLTTGAEVALDLLNRQIRGERPQLQTEQLESLERWRLKIRQADLLEAYHDGFLENFKVTEQGGGVVSVSVLDAAAYVGVGSLARAASLASGAAILFTPSLCFTHVCQLGPDSTVFAVAVIDDEFGRVELGGRARLENSRIRARAVRMSDDALVVNSSFSGRVLRVDRSAELVNSSVRLSSREFLFAGTELRLREGSSLSNLAVASFKFRSVDVRVSEYAGYLSLGVLMVPTLAREAIMRNYALVIQEGARIDAADQILCRENGQNAFADLLGYRAAINGREDFERRCLSAPK